MNDAVRQVPEEKKKRKKEKRNKIKQHPVILTVDSKKYKRGNQKKRRKLEGKLKKNRKQRHKIQNKTAPSHLRSGGKKNSYKKNRKIEEKKSTQSSSQWKMYSDLTMHYTILFILYILYYTMDTIHTVLYYTIPSHPRSGKCTQI